MASRIGYSNVNNVISNSERMDFCTDLLQIINYIGSKKICLSEGEAVLKEKHIICCGILKKETEFCKILALCLQTSNISG